MTTALKMTDVTLPGQGYPNIRDFVSPVFPNAGGLIGLYTFGPRQELSVVNHVNEALPLIPHGAIPAGVGGAKVSKAGYFDTQLAQDDEYTIIALCLPLVASSYNDGQLLYSNYQNGAAVQGESTAFYGNIANSVPSVGTFLNASGNTVVPKPMALPAGVSAGRHAGFGVRVNADGSTKVFVRDKGVLTTGVSTAVSRMALAPRSMLIGPGYVTASSWAGELTVKVLAVWNQALSDQQITDNLSYLTELYSDITSG